MRTDPILREVYRMKDQLTREIGGDVGKLFDLLRESAKQHPERMVNPLHGAKKRARDSATGKR